MKYQHVLKFVSNSAWAILPSKMTDIIEFLSAKAYGADFTPEEISARIGDERQASAAARRGSIAVIPLRGTIANRMDAMSEMSGGMSCERFVAMLRAAVADDSVGTIVLDIDSPGGTVVGVPEAAAAVFEARASKRIVAVANPMMASAAYWIGAAAHEIYGHPSAFEPMIGSIGVYTVHKDMSEALAKEGVKLTVISAGKHKVDGNPTEPLSDETKARIQGAVDAAYAAFTSDVARFRGVKASDVRSGFGEGMALSSKDAKAAGLIDKIGTLEDVLGRLTGSRSNAGGMRAEATIDLPEGADLAAVAEHIEEAVNDQMAAFAASEVERLNTEALNGAGTDTPVGIIGALGDMQQRLDRI